MAEHIARTRMGDQSGWRTASAGVFAMDGMPISEGSLAALAELGIDAAAHCSRALTPELVDEAKYIVVMTASHRDSVLYSFPEMAGKTHLITAFGTGSGQGDIDDPIGGSLALYRKTRDQIDGAVADLLLYLIERNELKTS